MVVGWRTRSTQEVVDEHRQDGTTGHRRSARLSLGSGWNGEPPTSDGVDMVADDHHDRLGAGGVVFVNGHCCCPAR